MRRGVFLLAMAAVAGPASAVFVYTGGTMLENFDGISATTVTGFFPATVGQTTNVTGSTFDGTRLGGTGTTMNLNADDGSNNSGAIHSLGAVGSGERALGLLASGTHIPAIGVEIRNGTGFALGSLTVRFTQENWRTSTSTAGTPNIMTAAWGRTGGGMTAADYMVHASMTNLPVLDLVGPPPVASNGPLDGNLAVNQVGLNHTFTFTTPLAAGDSVFLRWQDFNDQGNDADLAIDNFFVTGTVVPEPATLAVLSVGALAMLRKRKR